MKFRTRALSALFILILTLCMVPQTAYAMAEAIESMTVDAILRKNGDLAVEETIAYRLTGGAEKLVRKIDMQGTDGVPFDSVSVSEIKDGKAEPLTEKPGAAKGDTNAYDVSVGDSPIREIRIYTSSEGISERTFVVRYTLKNAAARYDDGARLNWTLLDKGNISKIDALTVNVRFENPVPAEGYWYGADEERFLKAIAPKNGVLSAEASPVEASAPVRLDLIFDASAVPDGMRFEPASLNSIRKDAEKAMAERERTLGFRPKWEGYSWIAAGIMGLLAFVCLRAAVVANKMVKDDLRITSFRPALVQVSLDPVLSGGGITAMLIDLLRRGILRVDADGKRISAGDRSKEMDSSERLFLEFLESNMENGGVALEELARKMKENPAGTRSALEGVRQALLSEKKALGIGTMASKSGPFAIAAGVVFVVQTVMTVLFASPLAFFALAASVVCLIVVLVGTFSLTAGAVSVRQSAQRYREELVEKKAKESVVVKAMWSLVLNMKPEEREEAVFTGKGGAGKLPESLLRALVCGDSSRLWFAD